MPPDGARTRPVRAFGVLLLGAVLGSTAYLLVITVTPVLADRFLSGSPWLGLPNAALIVGVSFGAPLLSRLIPGNGRVRALALGFLVAALAAAFASAASAGSSFLPFVLCCLLLGAGHAAYHLIRYSAALLVPARSRGRAVGLVVWASVVASFLAPALFSGIEWIAAAWETPSIGLTYLVSAALFGSIGVLFVRSRALAARRAFAPARPGAPGPRRHAGGAAAEPSLARRDLVLAVVSMVAAQAAMMVMMTMTPVQVVAGGGSLTGLGAIMGAHTLGMFLLSPLVGYGADRFGERPVIAVGGALLLVSGVLGAVAPVEAGFLMGLALYLLGLGWCVAFVAASALLSRGPDTPAKVRRQGRADSLNWFVAALASVGSGLLMSRFGFPTVAAAAAVLGLVPLIAALSGMTRAWVRPAAGGSAPRGSAGGGPHDPA